MAPPVTYALLLVSPIALPVWWPGHQAWARVQCERREMMEGARPPQLECPMWCVLCQGGQAWLQQVRRWAAEVLWLPTGSLGFRLPQLFDIHQVSRVSGLHSEVSKNWGRCVTQWVRVLCM